MPLHHVLTPPKDGKICQENYIQDKIFIIHSTFFFRNDTIRCPCIDNLLKIGMLCHSK